VVSAPPCWVIGAAGPSSACLSRPPTYSLPDAGGRRRGPPLLPAGEPVLRLAGGRGALLRCLLRQRLRGLRRYPHRVAAVKVVPSISVAAVRNLILCSCI
jgi:hypothetical protein